MNSALTLKKLLLALILVGLGLSSVTAQSSGPAFEPTATAEGAAGGASVPASRGHSANKSAHSVRRHHQRHQRRLVRNRRVHHRHQKQKVAANEHKSTTQAL